MQEKKINLEAASSKLRIVNPESPPQARISSLPPDTKDAKHSVAFWSILHIFQIAINFKEEEEFLWKVIPAVHCAHQFEELSG